MSDKKLLPCPFCGPQSNEDYRPSLRGTQCLLHDYQIGVTVFCPCCGLELHDECETNLLKRWNTRATLAELKGQDDD